MLYSNLMAERENVTMKHSLDFYLSGQCSGYRYISSLSLFLSHWHWIERVEELLSICHATSQKGRDISYLQKYIHLNTLALTLLLLLSQLSYLTRYSRFKIPRGLWLPTRHGVLIVECYEICLRNNKRLSCWGDEVEKRAVVHPTIS